MDNTKIERVKNWQTPFNMREVQKFLGSTGYYRYFIQDYLCITQPLLDLTQKIMPWHWEDCQHNNTWEPIKQLYAPELVKQYHRHHPLNKIKSALLTRLRSCLPSWPPLLSHTTPSPLMTQTNCTPSPMLQTSPLTINRTSFSPPSSDNSPLHFIHPSHVRPVHHCDRW